MDWFFILLLAAAVLFFVYIRNAHELATRFDDLEDVFDSEAQDNKEH